MVKDSRKIRRKTPAVEKLPEMVAAAKGDLLEYIDHIRCPACGMMARIKPDDKHRAESRRRIPCWEEGPYTAERWIQGYGWIPAAKKEDKPVRMQWVKEVNGLTADERELVIRNLRGALAALEAE